MSNLLNMMVCAIYMCPESFLEAFNFVAMPVVTCLCHEMSIVDKIQEVRVAMNAQKTTRDVDCVWRALATTSASSLEPKPLIDPICLDSSIRNSDDGVVTQTLVRSLLIRRTSSSASAAIFQQINIATKVHEDVLLYQECLTARWYKMRDSSKL